MVGKMFRQEALLGGSGGLVVRPAARPVPAQAETPADHRNISQGPGAWSPHPAERKPRTSPGDHRLDVRIHQKTGEISMQNDKVSGVVWYTAVANGSIVSSCSQ